jgi:TonB family protein
VNTDSSSTSNGLLTEEDREKKLLKKLIYVSLGLHLLLMVLDPSMWFFRSVPDAEWVIEAELLNIDDMAQEKKPDSIKEAKTAEDMAVNEHALPQVTKKFALDQKKPDDDSPPDPDKPKEEKKEDPDAKKLEDLKPLAKDTNPEEDDNVKKLALDRILKEKARLEKKFAKENTSPLNETLLKRKAELKSLMASGYSLSSMNSGYAAVLKKWISHYYSLPDIYNYSDAGLKASVQVILDAAGNLQKITLYESSRDPVFDSLALKTIQDSSPFPTPPADWVGKVILFPFEPGKRK